MVDTFDHKTRGPILEISDRSCTRRVAKKHHLSAKFGTQMQSSFIVSDPPGENVRGRPIVF
jgi:hypothetical protein